MRFFLLFAFAFFSLSSAQALNVDRPNISSVVQNRTIAHLSIQLNGTNEELSLAKYQSNQSSDQLNQTKYELEQLKEQLNQTKYQLDEAHKQREVDKANAERCVSQVAALNVYNVTVKPNWFQRGRKYFREKADFTWVVQGVDAFLNGSTRELFSEEFELRGGYQFKARAKLQWYDETRVTFGLSFNDKDGRIGPIDVTVFPKIMCIIKDQSSNIERQDRVSLYNYYFTPNQRTYDTFYYYQMQSNATDVINTTLYTANDTMLLDIHVEPLELAELAYSYNGTLTWAVENYKERKHSASRKCISSPNFYTSSKGFRVLACVFLNGYGNYTNKGLTMRFSVVNGRFDKYLEKFDSHQVTVTFFHPTQEGRKIIKQITTDELKSTIDVGSHEEIDELVYEDTLYYNIFMRAT